MLQANICGLDTQYSKSISWCF